MLTYRRHVVQSLITLPKPSKVGRPISNTTASVSLTLSERFKSNYLSIKVSAFKTWDITVAVKTKLSQDHTINAP